MRNIWVNHKKSKVNISSIITLLFCLVTICVGIYGINMATNSSKEQETIELENSINRSINMCYAIEGSYPANIDYLKVNYGLDIDEDKYIVHYEIFASNIAPEVQVFKIN